MFSKFPTRLFVTGIDTDTGKSYATGWLARSLAEAGISVITQKFVQTGNVGISEDILVHRKLMGVPLQTADKLNITCPIIFTHPASPHLAAEIDAAEIDLNIISQATDTLSDTYSHVLIEGAGGLMVPLKGDYLTIDYIHNHHLPVALVTNSRLGSINHTLLALDAISHRHINLFAVIYNPYFDRDKLIAEDTRRFLRGWLASRFPDTLFLEMPKEI